MKHFLLLVLSGFYCFSCMAQGILEAKNPKMDLQKVIADDQHRIDTFTLKNTGTHPVIITRIVPLSPAFEIHWDNKPIAPGESRDIEISFASSSLAQEHFSHTILVYSNAQNRRMELEICGHVIDNPQKPHLLYKQTIDGLKFKSKHIGLGNIYTWQTLCDTIYLINHRQETVDLDILNKPAHIEAKFVPQQVQTGQKGALILTFSAPKKRDYGYSYEPITFMINQKKDYAYQLAISSNIIEDFSKLSPEALANAPIASFDQREFHFGKIRKGEQIDCDFVLTNRGKRVLHIRKTKTSCSCTTLNTNYPPLKPGESTIIRITFDSKGKSGHQHKTVTIITNDPKHPEIQLTIQGDIK